MDTRKEETLFEVATALYGAVNALAGVCDGARSWDNHGFNRFDVERGHRFAKEDPACWDVKKCRYVRKFLWKYRQQLLVNHGIDLAGIVDLGKCVLDQQNDRSVRLGNGEGNLIFSFPYDFDALSDLKRNWEYHRWDGKNRVWRINIVVPEEAELVILFAKKYSLIIFEEVRTMLDCIIGGRKVGGGEKTNRTVYSATGTVGDCLGV